MASASDKYVLAIDMGSGSAKVALVSNSGDVAASALRNIHTLMLSGGGAEQDPEEWWSAVTGAAKSVLADSRVDPEQIAAVACTTQWSVTVPVDERGVALCNAISWMDSRGAPYNRAITGGWPSVQGYAVRKLVKWIRLSGGAPLRSGVDGLGHILYLKHERPDIYARTWKLLEPMDYLNLRLTGHCAASYATIFPYWLTDNRNPNRIDYNAGLLRLAGVERSKMPDLLPVNAILGRVAPKVAAELGLSPQTKVVMGSCDSQAATIGAGAVRDYDGYFYIGTTSWLSCHVPAKKTDLLHMLSTMPAALAGHYMVGAEQGAAGRCLELLKELFFLAGDDAWPPPSDVYGYLNRAAAEVAPGSDGLIFTPWINGVMAPSEDPYTRSAFFNQTARTTRGHYARAVMEGIAFNLRWLKRHVEKFIGRRFDHLNFIGGGAQSDLWCQIQADVLGCQVRQVAHPLHANAVGAAMAAFVAIGEVKLDDIASMVKIAAAYDPNQINRGVYDRQFREFMNVYKRMKPIYRRLNAVASTTRR
jgi:xylulokinase